MKMQESDWSGKLKQTTVLPAHEDTVRVRGHVRGVCDPRAKNEATNVSSFFRNRS